MVTLQFYILWLSDRKCAIHSCWNILKMSSHGLNENGFQNFLEWNRHFLAFNQYLKFRASALFDLPSISHAVASSAARSTTSRSCQNRVMIVSAMASIHMKALLMPAFSECICLIDLLYFHISWYCFMSSLKLDDGGMPMIGRLLACASCLLGEIAFCRRHPASSAARPPVIFGLSPWEHAGDMTSHDEAALNAIYFDRWCWYYARHIKMMRMLMTVEGSL